MKRFAIFFALSATLSIVVSGYFNNWAKEKMEEAHWSGRPVAVVMAESLQEKARGLAKWVLGPDHPLTLKLSEPVGELVPEAVQKFLGSGDPRMVESLERAMELYTDPGKYDERGRRYQRLEEIDRPGRKELYR